MTVTDRQKRQQPSPRGVGAGWPRVILERKHTQKKKVLLLPRLLFSLLFVPGKYYLLQGSVSEQFSLWLVTGMNER